MLGDKHGLLSGVSHIMWLAYAKRRFRWIGLVVEKNVKSTSGLMPVWVIALCLAVSVPLLFIGGPDYYDGRVVKLLWDLGHIPFMFFAGLLVLRVLARLPPMAYWSRCGIYFCTTLFIALITEYMQGKVGRVPSSTDVISDLWGALLAWVYAGCYPQARPFIWKATFSVLTVATGGLVLTTPVLILYDEWLAKTQFPLIAGFENSSELSRWSARSELVRSTDRATEGRHSLKVLLLPEGYSGASINDFPANWQTFDYVRVDIWSPLSLLPITVRMHDKQHVEGDQHYDDRFNRRYELTKGWNRVLIDLNDVLRSPKGRAFNLNDVEGLGLFSYNLGTVNEIYIDQLVLLRKESEQKTR